MPDRVSKDDVATGLKMIARDGRLRFDSPTGREILSRGYATYSVNSGWRLSFTGRVRVVLTGRRIAD